MKQTLLYIFYLGYLFFCGCHKPFCGETRGIETSSISISIFNTAANEYMYPRDEFRSPFKKDSLRVYTDGPRGFNFVEFGLAQDPKDLLHQYYGVKISPAFFIPEDNDAFNREKTKKIYLKYNYNTSDTLTLVFKAYKDKCDKGQYEYLKVYHRGNLISSINGTYYAVFTLNH
jgi:hypothetical protein